MPTLRVAPWCSGAGALLIGAAGPAAPAAVGASLPGIVADALAFIADCWHAMRVPISIPLPTAR